MDEQVKQAFIQYLQQKSGAQSEEEFQSYLQELGEEGIQQAYQEFMQLLQQQQVQSAKFGAKLNYIKFLRGQCPDGSTPQYFKQGGHICKKCASQVITAQEGSPVEVFRVIRKNKARFGNKYDEDQLAGRKPVSRDSTGTPLYLNGDGKLVKARNK